MAAGKKERVEIARDALESSRRSALRLGEQTGGKQTKALLEKAAKDLRDRLDTLSTRGLDESFTAAQLRSALMQVQAVLGPLVRGMKGVIVDSAAFSAEQAASHAIDYMQTAERAFRGVSQPLPLDAARMLSKASQGANASVLRRLALGADGTPAKRGVLERYGLETIKNFEQAMQVGLIAKKDWRSIRDDITEQSPFLQGAPAHWAQRIVRTEVMGAYARGAVESIKETDKQLGDMVKILSATFDERTGCLLGSTKLTGAVVRAVVRRTYEGPVARLVAESGRDLIATPKHPVLTRRGWVFAGELRLGDEVVCDRRQQRSSTSGDEDVNGRPPTLSEVFDSVSVLGHRERRRGSEQDFHGDGTNSDVDILRPFHELRFGNFATLDEPFAKKNFAPSDDVVFCHRCTALLGFGAGEERNRLWAGAKALVRLEEALRHRRLATADRSSDGFDRFAEVVATDNFVRRQLLTSGMHASRIEEVLRRLGARPTHTTALKCLEDVTAVRVHRCSDFAASHTREVEFDRLVDVQFRSFRGHVFNLTTEAGYYAANGFYTSNSDSYAVHGQIRRPDEPFESWYGPYDAPPNRPNDREVVTPHRIAWPIPPYLEWKDEDQIAARWEWEGRKGAPPERPEMTTVPLEKFGS